MADIRKVAIFGVGDVKPIKFDEGVIYFIDKESSEHLADYDIIIYSVGALEYKYEQGIWGSNLKPAPAAAIQRANEIQSALEKGKIVCFIGQTIQDYVVAEILNSNRISVFYFDHGKVFRNFKVKKSEFKSYLDDLGASAVGFGEDSIDNIICYAYENGVTGFSKKIGKGSLFFIPTTWGSTDPNYVIGHLKILVSSIVSFSAREVLEPPKYLEEFQFKREKEARKSINQIVEEQIQPLEKTINFYIQMKSILWLGNSNLVAAVNDFFHKIGLSTDVIEKYEEDLWILEKDEKIAIVEIKGLNNNLTRQDISKLDEHREARMVPDMTGLLIANTFRTANSITNKNQGFPPNVIEKAVNSNLLITRTIDLCKIVELLGDSEQAIGPILTKVMLNKKGWLTVEGNEIKVVTT